jgi:hypothetical protein
MMMPLKPYMTQLVVLQLLENLTLLTYRLSSCAVKASHINLVSSDDWEGCKEDIEAAEKKKKDKASVNILAPEIASNFCTHMFSYY